MKRSDDKYMPHTPISLMTCEELRRGITTVRGTRALTADEIADIPSEQLIGRDEHNRTALHIVAEGPLSWEEKASTIYSILKHVRHNYGTPVLQDLLKARTPKRSCWGNESGQNTLLHILLHSHSNTQCRLYDAKRTSNEDAMAYYRKDRAIINDLIEHIVSIEPTLPDIENAMSLRPSSLVNQVEQQKIAKAQTQNLVSK